MTRTAGSTAASVLLAAAVLLCAFRALPQINRPGYLLDEEITAAVVPSISQHAVPRLPSGLLYVRGMPYTYAAWLAGRCFGDSLTTYRWLSFLFALAAIGSIYWAGRVASGPLLGGTAAVILASMDAFTTAAAFARPYSLLVAATSLTLALFVRTTKEFRSPWPFLIGLAMCRLLHEFGTVLAFLPLIQAFVLDRDDPARRHQFHLFWSALGIALGLEIILFLVVNQSLNHLFVPLTASPAFRPLRLPPLPPLHLFEVGTAFSVVSLVVAPLILVAAVLGRSTRRWIFVAVCCALAAGFQLGALMGCVAVVCVLRPQQTLRSLAIGGVTLMAAVVVWSLHTVLMSSVQFSWSLPGQLAAPMLHYPMSGVRDFVGSRPELAAAWFAGTLSLLGTGAQTAAGRAGRSLALFSIFVLLGYGVLGIGSQPRFSVLTYPALVLTAALGIVQAARAAVDFLSRSVKVPSVGTVTVLLACSLAAIGSRVKASDEAPRFTSVAPHIEVGAGDIVICSEELACRYLVGRIDYLILGHQTDFAYYTGHRDGQSRGLYANSPVVESVEELTTLVTSTEASKRLVVIIFDTGKVFELECLAIADKVAGRFGEGSYRTEDTYVYYLRRDGKGITAPGR